MTTPIIFCHIEKCAGTTLVSKFRKELPFKSADFLARGNRPRTSELKALARLYPRLHLVSGHSLYPNLRSMFETQFGPVRMFTVVREPISRLISNYYYDKRRGIWLGNLEDYMRIPWKQNYLLRFLGAGEVEAGQEGFDSLDDFLLVSEIESYLKPMLSNFGLEISDSVPPQNEAKPDTIDLPADLRALGGESFGRYKIQPDILEEMRILNAQDLNFYQDAVARSTKRKDWIAPGNSASFQAKASPIVKLAHVYRNSVYKLSVLKKLGHHSLPRNRFNPSLVEASRAFSD